MKMLYKYYSVSEHSLKNISNSVVCFSDILGFNDPFEGVGHFKYEATPEMQEYFNSIDSNALNYLSEGTAANSKELLSFKHRVFCVTEKYDHPLIWAHYAGSHTGFCVGYDEENIKKISDKFDDVEYAEHPHLVDVNQLDMDKVETLLYVKSKEWSYEEEWRAIHTITDADVTHLNPREEYEVEADKLYVWNGYAAQGNLELLAAKKYILKHCEPKVLYLGLKMDQEAKNELIRIAKEKKIDIFQMTQQSNSFKLATY
ncbi:DUF2971 domain-containing protein [Paenibacillus pasadenensis]|uniref:DUF2971 domain-containing protein n=1 Tax=Paenibacillus pasadenensis TaxID=217090 RepID=UPI0015E0F2AC|nr:DUF2971 domain-containing protein [Paenibacillus pasadenensis]